MTERELKKQKIGVLMGGTSSEREISLASGTAVLQSLLRSGLRAVAIDTDADLANKVQSEKIDAAFVALHGRWGEDGTVQGLMEMMRIPYTGTGVLGSALALDKCLTKLLLVSLGLPTPAYRICRSAEEVDMRVPFVVKPAREGSTIGLSIVKEKKQLKRAIGEALRYDSKLLIEEYVQGREITVGIVNGRILPIVEVKPRSGFYDFTSKYTKGMTEYLVPADLDRKTASRARECAAAVWEHFELCGCARIDMLVGTGVPTIIDVNTSPGMTETSLVPKAWTNLGKTFDQLVKEIVKGAALKA